MILSEAALDLKEFMNELCLLFHTYSWARDWEYVAYRSMRLVLQTPSPGPAPDTLTNEEAARLAQLSMYAGGWWTCDSACDLGSLRFVGAREWAPMYHNWLRHSSLEF